MRYAALARVSSREQEREGFSLDVQEDALKRYAQRQGGEIVQLYRIAETASRTDERKTFKELLAYVRQNKAKLDGVLFYKVDRAARNLFDYVEIERLEFDHGVPVIYVAQPTENSPAGRMQRRILSNMASFYTEQQSLDVREGMQRRVEAGWFIGKAPFGYKNVRIDGRSLIEVDEHKAAVVRYLYSAYASGAYTLDSLLHHLKSDRADLVGVQRLSRSGLHRILCDRAYLGEVPHHGTWHAGKHAPLVALDLWERVQSRLGGRVYKTLDLPWAGQLITCRDCGRPITGERKSKQTKQGEAFYTYYRCTRYTAPGHDRWRVKEQSIDAQFQTMLASMKLPDPKVADWFREVIDARAKARAKEQSTAREQHKAKLVTLQRQAARLLEMRMNDEIDAATFKAKHADLNASMHRITQVQQAAAGTEGKGGSGDLASKALQAFELSQTLGETWLSASPKQKRHIIEKVCLNCTLDSATLSATMRKPFDVLVKGLNSQNGRGERIRTSGLLVPNQAR